MIIYRNYDTFLSINHCQRKASTSLCPATVNGHDKATKTRNCYTKVSCNIHCITPEIPGTVIYLPCGNGLFSGWRVHTHTNKHTRIHFQLIWALSQPGANTGRPACVRIYQTIGSYVRWPGSGGARRIRRILSMQRYSRYGELYYASPLVPSHSR